MHSQDNIRTQSPRKAGPNTSIEVREVAQPLYESLLWIRLFAACLVFYGGLMTITGVGVLVAWIPMLIGVIFLLACKSIKTAYENNDPQALQLSLSRLKTIFTILGLSSVMLIVGSLYLVKYAYDRSLF